MRTWTSITLTAADATYNVRHRVQAIRAPIQRAIRRVNLNNAGAISTEKAGWILLSIVIVGIVYAALNKEINRMLEAVANEFDNIIGGTTSSTTTTI